MWGIYYLLDYFRGGHFCSFQLFGHLLSVAISFLSFFYWGEQLDVEKVSLCHHSALLSTSHANLGNFSVCYFGAGCSRRRWLWQWSLACCHGEASLPMIHSACIQNIWPSVPLFCCFSFWFVCPGICQFLLCCRYCEEIRRIYFFDIVNSWSSWV